MNDAADGFFRGFGRDFRGIPQIEGLSQVRIDFGAVGPPEGSLVGHEPGQPDQSVATDLQAQ